MEGLKPKQENEVQKEISQEWSDFEPHVRINGIDGLLRSWIVAVDDKDKVIKTQKDRQRVLMPRTEKRALIMLNGGSYGYGGYIDTGEEEKSSIETAETLKDKIKRRFRKTRTQVIRGKYIEKIPQQEDADEFSKAYFALQKLVQQGVLTPPVTGNDGPTLNDFFWESTRPVEVSELVKLFRERGIAVEK